MRPKTSRLLMVLMSSMLGACAGQSGTSSSTGADKAPKTLAYEPPTYVDAPRSAEPAPAPKPAPAPPKESVPEFVSEKEPADMVPVPAAGFVRARSGRPQDQRTDDGAGRGGRRCPRRKTSRRKASITTRKSVPAQDDGIVASEKYSEEEEEGAAKEDDIIGQRTYYEEDESSRDQGRRHHRPQHRITKMKKVATNG